MKHATKRKPPINISEEVIKSLAGAAIFVIFVIGPFYAYLAGWL